MRDFISLWGGKQDTKGVSQDLCDAKCEAMTLASRGAKTRAILENSNWE